MPQAVILTLHLKNLKKLACTSDADATTRTRSHAVYASPMIYYIFLGHNYVVFNCTLDTLLSIRFSACYQQVCDNADLALYG
ncbi:hypothetical protein CY34DRAFT_813917 [Suillus luteus UH-Slu-Lm8-n1]|uniref:Uncharacterized protein n=1 Tax=Suillus luteus UH-Slu-Lm8-n1 TaxID=930992 RepID=A0A0D0AFM8_9AGAM|nr:hypothetical protein CY34DRAFT_813917 [Suillus luteus UH-Slu-Lm8-n1]